jgi:glycosyltransferase involved in cell wall biosynthesis
MKTMGGVAAVIRSHERSGLFERWPTLHLATHADGTAPNKLLVAICAFTRFAGLLIRRRVLLVHVHAASNASFWRKSTFILLALLAHRPVIFHLHGGGFMDFYNRCQGGIRQRAIRFILDHATEIIVLTEEWRRRVSVMTTNANISVISNPVDIQFPVDFGQSQRKANVVLYLGRLEREKGLFELIDAISTVRCKFPDVQLWFAGDGNQAEISGYAAAKGLGDAVEFLGWVSGDAKARVLAEATVSVLPSYREGLPMAVLEAMAAGLPLVATRVGGIPDVVENGVTGILVEPKDSDSIAQAILKLLGDPALRTRMAEAGRARIAERYSIEYVIPQIEALYGKIMRGC